MMADFYEFFGKNTDNDKEIPKEVLELLNRDLPDNFMYVRDETGNYMAVPRPDKLSEGLTGTVKFDLDRERDAALLERLDLLPAEKWTEYFYRIQKVIPVKSAKIGDVEKQIPIEKTVGNPLHENHAAKLEMCPQGFPEPVTLLFETQQGEQVPVRIQQQAYDSLTEIKFMNVDFPALKMEFYCYAPLTDKVTGEASVTSREDVLHMNYAVAPSKAKTVGEVISALHIFQGLLDGTLKINGQVTAPGERHSSIDAGKIEDMLSLWTTARQLEKRLEVAFDPGADFPMEDKAFFKTLDTCLIGHREVLWEHPFYHFHIRGYQPADEEQQLEDFIGKENISYEFTEGPVKASLLGAEFHVYSRTKMKDFVITNIKWDDESKKSCEVYIADAPGKVWMLSRLYITEKEGSAC